MSGLFEGRVALVTGAGRGIGRAVAVLLAAEGAQVALVARSIAELDEAASTIVDSGGMARAFRTDLAIPAEVAATVAHVAADLSPVAILINNAAVVTPLGPTLEVDLTEWTTAFATNVAAAFQLTKAFLPSMLAQGWGRIVNVSSRIAAHPERMIGANAYAATKAALEAHTINLAAELSGSGVTVNGYRPGSVDTAMHAWIRAQSPDKIGLALHERFNRSYEQGSLLTAEDAARALVAQLPGEDTGQIWGVKGL